MSRRGGAGAVSIAIFQNLRDVLGFPPSPTDAEKRSHHVANLPVEKTGPLDVNTNLVEVAFDIAAQNRSDLALDRRGRGDE